MCHVVLYVLMLSLSLSHCRDNREVAFQQLQRSLASKDFELAQCQQRVSDLNNEVADLRKIKQREGINMDYLKNVVFQVCIIVYTISLVLF